MVALCLSGCLFIACRNEKTIQKKPNIVIILADDMGYGDVTALNPNSKIPTPNIDRLAAEGMIFTDAHSNSAVCTPTRYGLLTGRYCFRTRLKAGVLAGFSPSLIEPGRETLATFLKKQGYHSACIGKWHLGIDWKKKNPDKPLWEGFQYLPTSSDNVDYAAPVDGGPLDCGFDYSFIAPAAISFPYCYIENRHVTDTNMFYMDALEEGVKGLHYRRGHASRSFEIEQVMPQITNKSVEYIQNRSKAAPGKPFFLYFALTAPHRPYVPTQQFVGTSEAGLYGDFCVQVDDAVGRITEALQSAGVSDNTLLVFTSDNGARWDNEEIEKYRHNANFIFRGMKSMAYEGGHRVPFVVKWPGKMEPGSVSSQMVNMTDFLMTFADYFDTPLDYNSAEDSYSFLPDLLDTEPELPLRDHLINRTFKGKTAIRKGNWKLIMHNGHGGIFVPDTALTDTPYQLYNLKDDISETNNLYIQEKIIADSLEQLFKMYDEERRSSYFEIKSN